MKLEGAKNLCFFDSFSSCQRAGERGGGKGGGGGEGLVTAAYATRQAIDWFPLSRERAGLGEFVRGTASSL